MVNLNNIRTGDIAIYSNNKITSTLIKIFTSSCWSHIGVIIRINDNLDITHDNTGTIYVLEMNAFKRNSDIKSTIERHLSFTRIDDDVKIYPTIIIRKLNDKYRSPEFISKIYDFYERYKNSSYPSDVIDYLPFVIGTTPVKNDSIFCTTMIVKFYMECIADTVSHVDNTKPITNPSSLFGRSCPDNEDEYTPKHFHKNYSHNSIIFTDESFTYYHDNSVIIYSSILSIAIMLYIILIIITILLVIVYIVRYIVKLSNNIC